jgi:hypothetical protein
VCEKDYSDECTFDSLRCRAMKRKKKKGQQSRKRPVHFTADEEAFFREGDTGELESAYEEPTSWLRRLFLRVAA